MEQRFRLRLSLAVYLFALWLPFCAQASSLCHQVVSGPSALDVLISYETRLQELQNSRWEYVSPSARSDIQAKLFEHGEVLDQLLAQLGSDSDSVFLKRHELELGHLNDSIKKIEESLDRAAARETNHDYFRLQMDPSLVKAERLYKVESQYPYLERILFSKEVVDGIFHSDSPLMKRAAAMILRSVLKAPAGSGQNGIDQFVTDRSIFKIRILGTAVGAVRAAGYFVGRDFYVVRFAQESSHDERTSQALVDAVRAERARRGH